MTATQSVMFGGSVDALEVLTFNWENLTYSVKMSLVQQRSFVACALAKEDDHDDEDRLDDDDVDDVDDKAPKVIISSGTNGLFIFSIRLTILDF